MVQLSLTVFMETFAQHVHQHLAGTPTRVQRKPGCSSTAAGRGWGQRGARSPPQGCNWPVASPCPCRALRWRRARHRRAARAAPAAARPPTTQLLRPRRLRPSTRDHLRGRAALAVCRPFVPAGQDADPAMMARGARMLENAARDAHQVGAGVLREGLWRGQGCGERKGSAPAKRAASAASGPQQPRRGCGQHGPWSPHGYCGWPRCSLPAAGTCGQRSPQPQSLVQTKGLVQHGWPAGTCPPCSRACPRRVPHNVRSHATIPDLGCRASSTPGTEQGDTSKLMSSS